MKTISCQIQGINKDLWVKFRQTCLAEGISATAKVRALIEAVVVADGHRLSRSAEQMSVERKDQ